MQLISADQTRLSQYTAEHLMSSHTSDESTLDIEGASSGGCAPVPGGGLVPPGLAYQHAANLRHRLGGLQTQVLDAIPPRSLWVQRAKNYVERYVQAAWILFLAELFWLKKDPTKSRRFRANNVKELARKMYGRVCKKIGHLPSLDEGSLGLVVREAKPAIPIARGLTREVLDLTDIDDDDDMEFDVDTPRTARTSEMEIE